MEMTSHLQESAFNGPHRIAGQTALADMGLPATDKLPDNDHGNRFQSKLLLLSFIRAIKKDYSFHLGTELFKFAGKFDDLIFVKNDSSDDGQPIKSYLYLQAKHRMYEKPHPKAKNLVTADLLNDNKGDFSLIKYFHSYRDYVMKAEGGPKPGDKTDCVICTNIGFDVDDLIKNGVELTPLVPDEHVDTPRKLITFKPFLKQPQTNEGKKEECKGTNHLGLVANYLHKWAQSPSNPPCQSNQSFQKYFDELLSNNTIVILHIALRTGRIR